MTYFTNDHEWLTLDGDVATVGITRYAADALGDLVFVDVKPDGTFVAAKDSAAVVESVKAASDIYAPASGEVTQTNPRLAKEPEIVNADPKQSVVVLVDTAAYATRGIKLAEKLKSLDMPLVIVTDKFSHWAFAYTRFVFEAHTHVKTFWDSTASLGVVLNLMIDAVATRLGPKAKRNFAMMSDMGNLFGEFVGGSYLRRKD